MEERCNMLMEKDQLMEKQNKSLREEESEDNVFVYESLSAALDSLDNLFCRRCLVFNCRLHGGSQNVIYPNEKQPYPSDLEEDRKPCSDECYLQLNGLKDLHKSSAVNPLDEHKASDEEGRTPLSPYIIEQAHHLESEGRCIILEPTNSMAKASELVSAGSLSSSSKKLKLVNPNPPDHSMTLVGQVRELGGSHEFELKKSASISVHVFDKHNLDAFDCPYGLTGNKVKDVVQDKGKDTTELPLEQRNFIGNSVKASYGWSEWKPFEKDLYLKGLEIFGRNSCFIARNLLPGLRTCTEVFSYMYGDGAMMSHGSSSTLGSFFKDVEKADMDHMEPNMPVKSRICRRKGRMRTVKSSWKSAGHPSLWRRIADGTDELYKQYVPCGCQSLCGKQCPCLQNGTCCEKYCGCSKSCKNRFRGCYCAKSQCRSRQCPCFAADRECDPDVCRNCWISCGDGSLGEPPRQGESQCGNMKLLLGQKQTIVVAKSAVAGRGAFLKDSVNKGDCLGEYTGELITHEEADKRGEIYDRANLSFLFNLNDKYVIDAYHKGGNLKFANHSLTPNCYARVMFVAGDHRIGIYANERIKAGEEIFFDYRYGPDEAPPWAQKPEALERDDLPVPQGRAKKHQSG